MSLLLNKIPCLDKGFVAQVAASSTAEVLNNIAAEYYKKLDGKFLNEISSLTLLIKCPLFVQLNLTQFPFKVMVLPTSEPEYFSPNPGEIGAQSLELSRAISQDMEQTSAALLINPKAYQQDGCDRFLSQILTPINTYTTLLVHGMYNDWCKFATQKNAPTCIAPYLVAVADILKAEWR